ncbi:Protein of unknown function [Gryllus bimaculatus]|nr:Protein of unknown function [Gryllus bimaculatus]
MSDFIIREATRDDCQGILALVQFYNVTALM